MFSLLVVETTVPSGFNYTRKLSLSEIIALLSSGTFRVLSHLGYFAEVQLKCLNKLRCRSYLLHRWHLYPLLHYNFVLPLCCYRKK